MASGDVANELAALLVEGCLVVVLAREADVLDAARMFDPTLTTLTSRRRDSPGSSTAESGT